MQCAGHQTVACSSMQQHECEQHTQENQCTGLCNSAELPPRKLKPGRGEREKRCDQTLYDPRELVSEVKEAEGSSLGSSQRTDFAISGVGTLGSLLLKCLFWLCLES